MSIRGLLLPLMVLPLVLGCQTTRETWMVASRPTAYRGVRITAVTLRDGTRRDFDEFGGMLFEDTSGAVSIHKIIGFDPKKKPQTLDISNVLEVCATERQADTGGTLLIVIIAGALALTIGFLVGTSTVLN